MEHDRPMPELPTPAPTPEPRPVVAREPFAAKLAATGVPRLLRMGSDLLSVGLALASTQLDQVRLNEVFLLWLTSVILFPYASMAERVHHSSKPKLVLLLIGLAIVLDALFGHLLYPALIQESSGVNRRLFLGLMLMLTASGSGLDPRPGDAPGITWERALMAMTGLVLGVYWILRGD
jgi:hypothetical protein